MTRSVEPVIRVLSTAEAAVPIVLDEIRRAAGEGRKLLGLATGGTYAASWRALGDELQAGRLRPEFLLTHLDEYLDFGPERRGGMVHELVTACPPIAAMLRAGTFLPVPHLADPAALATHEQRLTRAGGVALQFLGIGRNGHIAFNEPGTAFDRGFHVTALAETTRSDARSRFAPDEVPRRAITSGIATILGARRLVLSAFGQAKAAAVAAMLRGEINPQCPASALRRHADVLVLLDHEAAAGLDRDLDRVGGAGE
ncbi:MAG: 6-phosphogluconolactonase [Planctomycetes bacterium]|nr:6-phosphogluconolactonase [Planctomycetota bacterium]